MDVFDRRTPAALFAAVAAGAAIKYAAGMLLKKPENYVYVGQVGELWVFPFKSFRGIKVEEADITRYGLSWKGLTDRHWTCTTPDGVYLTQRQVPPMALIEPVSIGDEIELRAPGMTPIRIPRDPEPTKANLSKATVKLDTVPSVDLGDEVGAWLSSYLKRDGLRLHYSAPSLQKRDSYNAKKNWVHPAKKGDMCAFSDYCGFMILSNESLRVLNTKLEKPVPVKAFRGNIIVDGCEAFAEDAWKRVRIGSSQLRALDPCTRCILVTVDQDKGVKDENEEPLATLKQFRKSDPYGEKPMFGMNHTYEKPGTIRVGDPIYAMTT